MPKTKKSYKIKEKNKTKKKKKENTKKSKKGKIKMKVLIISDIHGSGYYAEKIKEIEEKKNQKK